MNPRIEAGGLLAAEELHRLVNDEIIPGTGVQPDDFWLGLARIVRDLGPRNRELLKKREAIQQQIDQWHRENPGKPDPEAYRQFLNPGEKPESAFEIKADNVTAREYCNLHGLWKG